MCLFLTDRIGRRPLHIFGSTFLIVFDFMIGGLGLKKIKSNADVNAIVASFIMMLWSTKMSWATHCCESAYRDGLTPRYDDGRAWRSVNEEEAWVPTVILLMAVVMLGVGSDVVWAFAVSFSAPYIMNHIGAGIGYIFGGSSVIALIYAILFLPELAGRGLEEVDELFEVSEMRDMAEISLLATAGDGSLSMPRLREWARRLLSLRWVAVRIWPR